MSSRLRVSGRAAILLAAVALLALPLGAAAQGKGPSSNDIFPPGLAKKVTIAPANGELQVVASGLNNPRGLAFSPDGGLYVAEAGVGGTGVCLPDPEDPTSEVCAGDTGSITRINLKKGTQERIATGLPSIAGESGEAAAGPHDISFHGKGNGYISIGLGADPAVRELIGSGFGWLAKMPASGKWRYKADVSQHEADENPDGGEVDSNPYGVLALPDGNAVVADAGGNSLIHVNVETGDTETLAVFPDRVVPVDPSLQGPPFDLPPAIPAQAVPTAVTMCPDGNYYVSQLLGFPFTAGESYVWKVVPGEDPVPYAMGLTAMVDITCDNAGNLYVVEMAKEGLLGVFFGSGDPTGAVIRIAPDGTQTEIASDGLILPGGVAIAPDGSLYVTNFSVVPGGGQVVHIMP